MPATDEKVVLNGLATLAINLPIELAGLPEDRRAERLTAFRDDLAVIEKTLEEPEIREAVREIAEIVEDRLRLEHGSTNT